MDIYAVARKPPFLMAPFCRPYWTNEKIHGSEVIGNRVYFKIVYTSCEAKADIYGDILKNLWTSVKGVREVYSRVFQF